MKINYKKQTIIVSIISMLILSVMVPGGPVETRDLSYMDKMPIIPLLFNVFLTTLAIFTLFILPYFMYRKQKWAFTASILTGISYILVFALDLLNIFPSVPYPMPRLLFIFEIIGLVFGFILSFWAYKSIKTTKNNYWNTKSSIPKWIKLLLFVIFLFGVYVVFFSTNAVLNK